MVPQRYNHLSFDIFVYSLSILCTPAPPFSLLLPLPVLLSFVDAAAFPCNLHFDTEKPFLTLDEPELQIPFVFVPFSVSPVTTVQPVSKMTCFRDDKRALSKESAFGRLVQLGFDITAFTPTAYLRSSLLRPFREVLSWGRLRA